MRRGLLAILAVVVSLLSQAEADATVLTAVGNQGVIVRSLDSGETWTRQSSGTGPINTAPALRDVDFIDEDNGWAVGESIALDPTVRRTANGGQSWGGVTLPPAASQPGHGVTGVQFVNADVGWIIGTPGLIFHTTDGGLSWLQQSNGVPSQLEFYDLHFVDGDNGWAVGHGGILHTADGGATWNTQLTTQNPDIPLGVDFVDASTGWTVGTQTARHTTDGGATWNNRGGGYLRDVDFIDPMHGWAVGKYGVILHTSDGGVNWSEQFRSVEPTDHLNAVDFINSDEGWAAGESGIIVHTTDGGATWVPQTSNTVRALQDIMAIIDGVEAPLLDADFDDDGDVDGDDFLLWQTGFGTSQTGHLFGDADWDGDTDGDDFLIWQSQFGSGSGSASAAVPEPAAIVLLIAAVVLAVFSKRRH